MRFCILTLAALLCAGTSAFAQGVQFAGTVDEVTPAMKARGEAAVTRAGYHPTTLQFGQDGNLFFTATKGDETYDATVTRGGKVYVSNGLPTSASSRS